MYTKKVYSLKDLILWTRVEIYYFIGIAFLEVILFIISHHMIQIPFTPVALIGTAVAFLIGFQSNSAYGRIWEARKIWGAIVNSSRTFGMMVQSYIQSKNENQQEVKSDIKTLIYRHIAWLTALRYAMREHKPWEYVKSEYTNREWSNMIYIPEHQIDFKTAVQPYLSQSDWNYISNKSNKQTALLYLQSQHLKRLKDQGLLWEFSFLELENVLEELFTHQGKSERIKNFPYPRQFESILYYFTWIFLGIIPLATASQFAELGMKLNDHTQLPHNLFVWLSIPFSVLVMWIFHTMNRIGRVGENPFEGTPNDVPISAIARGIEIDLRQNLGENPAEIPAPFEVKNDTQM